MSDPLVKIWKDAMQKRERHVMTDLCLFLAHIAGDSNASEREKQCARKLLAKIRQRR